MKNTKIFRLSVVALLLFEMVGCGGGGGSSATPITVTPPPVVTPPAPTVTISASQKNAAVAQSITLSWSGTNNTNCSASGNWTGQLAVSGSQTVTLSTAGSNTYTITCGTATATTAVNTLPQYTAIPDANFQAALTSMGVAVTNGSINTSDALGIDTLIFTTYGCATYNPSSPSANSSLASADKFAHCYNTGTPISDMTGLENFVNLMDLEVDHQQFTSVNVSPLVLLTHLSFWAVPLTTIDVSKNVALTTLGISETPLTTVDISKLTALVELDFQNYWNGGRLVLPYITSNGVTVNGYSNLDISHNVNLRRVYIMGNNIAALDTTHNAALNELWADSNNLTSVNVSSNTNLTFITVDYNNLNYLNIAGTQIGGSGTMLNTVGNPNLKQVLMSNAKITIELAWWGSNIGNFLDPWTTLTPG